MNNAILNTPSSRKGLVGTIIFHLILLLIFFFWGLYPSVAKPKHQGIIVNFGNTQNGQGKQQPSKAKAAAKKATQNKQAKEAAAAAAAKPAKPKPVAEKKMLESKTSKGPALPKKDLKKSTKKKDANKKDTKVKEAKVEKKTDNTKTEEAKVVPQKKKQEIIDKDALFKPSQQTNQSSSQGNSANPTGDAGFEKGDPNAQTSANSNDISRGQANSGIGYDLTGRELRNIPPIIDNSQIQGRVVVKIKVDKYGKVISASTTRGTTISDAGIKAMAIKTAEKATFNFAPDAPEVQLGTITFNFQVQ